MRIQNITKFKELAVIFAFTVIFPSDVIAEQPGEPASVIVVTASRLDSTKLELSQSVEILTREDIQSRNAANVTELLRQVAGISVIQQGARGNVTSVLIRGGEPNFTVVQIDGVKINDPTNTRGGSYDFSYIDPSNIERIEIVRGPMSALHGSDSLAGIINIITRSGKDGSGVSAEVGGHGLKSVHADVGIEVGHLDGYLRAHALSEDGDIEGSSYEDVGVNAGFSLVVDENMDWGANIRILDSESSGFPEDSGGPILAVLRGIDTRDVSEAHARIYLNQSFESGWSVALSLGHYDRQEIFSSPGIAPGVFDGVPPNSADTEFGRQELEASVAYVVADWLSFSFGGEWQSEDGRSVGILDIGFPLPTDFELERDTVSAFAESKMHWKSAHFQASVRRDDPDGVSGETSAQLGVVFDLSNDTVQLTANWGQGFKAPSFFALAHPLVGNPNLLSETADNLDVGFRYNLAGGAGEIEFSLFKNRFENLIDFDPVLFTNVNRSQVQTSGAEFTISLDLSKSLNVRGHVSYLDTEVQNSDARLRGRPNWRFGAVIDWTINDKLQLVSSVLALDDFWEVSIPTGGMFLNGYERVDLAMTFRATERLRLTFAIDNLLDQGYQEAVGFPGAGIRGRIGARLNF